MKSFFAFLQQLKNLCWGSASMPPKNEWLKQGIVFNPQEQVSRATRFGEFSPIGRLLP
jgi:hypothetical protein